MQRRLVSLAVSDLNQFWRGLDLSSPEAARDALLEFVPALTDKYGDFAAVVASDWYEEVRAAAGVTGRLTPELVRTVRREVVEGSVKYAAGGLFTDTPDRTLAIISGAVDRYVKSPARETIRVNAARDGARYARVPAGATTCAFCTMMSSRGFVYHDEHRAQNQGRGQEQDRYHDDCDCQIVPDWSDNPVLEGYDPDGMYEQYKDAREAADSGNPGEILAKMREMYGLA